MACFNQSYSLRCCLWGAIQALLALAAWFVVGVWIEPRSPAALGWQHCHLGRDLGLGLVVGAGIMSATVGVLALAGWYQVNGSGKLATSPGLLLTAVFFYLLVAVFAEVLYRGVLF